MMEAKYRFLIVDDSKTVHAFLQEVFKKVKGVEWVDAFNGDEALAKLSTDKNFDLIFLDWEMPVKTGPETIQAIRAGNITIPVLMMTSRNKPEDIEQMLVAGASEYLMKPFTADILIEKIAFACGKTLAYAA